MSGFLPIPRDFFTQVFWSEERSFSKAEACIDLLHFAAYAPSERIVSGKLIRLDEGECIASVRFLAVRWGWGKDKSAKFLNLLESRQDIRRESRQGETIVILCRYKDWKNQTDVSADRKTDTDKDSEQTPTRTNKKKGKKMERAESSPAPLPDNDWHDEFPTEVANDFDTITSKINALTPPWTRRPALTYQEMIDLKANSKAFFDLEEKDWQLLKAYLCARIPEEWAADKFFQPDNRSMFIKIISDILGKADRWAVKAKWKPKND